MGEPVAPGITEVDDRGTTVDRRRSHERGAHPERPGVLGGGAHRPVDQADAIDHLVERRRSGLRREYVDGDPAGDVSVGVATHAVGDREPGRAAQRRVVAASGGSMDTGSRWLPRCGRGDGE